MNLYSRQGFACAGRLPSFYHIATGRQPDPATTLYDAYLYVQWLVGEGPGWCYSYSPWDVVSLAVLPLRMVWGRLHACMPSFCR